MDDRRAAILESLRRLTSELLELSARNAAALEDEEIEELTRRLQGIRAEIERLRKEFHRSLG